MRALLREIEATAIRWPRDGDKRRVERPLGASLDPFREHIIADRLGFLAKLLTAEFTAAVNVEPPDVDRPAYVRLMARWYAAEADMAAGWNGDELERSRQPQAEARSAGDQATRVAITARGVSPSSVAAALRRIARRAGHEDWQPCQDCQRSDIQ